jgi:transcriptional regulator with XRE-family HTH domain
MTAATVRRPASSPVGELLREWRTRRNRSQLAVSNDVGVSTRHLSFVETGRSRPSPELVLALADHLEVPLRARNELLLAAGYAPRYTERRLEDPEMEQVARSLRRMLDAHDPYPGVVIDRAWNVVLANHAALRLLDGVPSHLLEPQPNVFRLCLHPDGLAARTLDLPAWAAYLLGQLRRAAALTADRELAELRAEVESYPGLPHPSWHRGAAGDDHDVLVPFRFRTTDGSVLSLFTTLTSFGTPRDITVEELALELFFPADGATERLLRA